MLYAPGDSWLKTFDIYGATGVSVAADSLPTAAVWRNGSLDNAVAVTITDKLNGRYKAACTIPVGYASGDLFEVVASATVGGIIATNVVFSTLLFAADGITFASFAEVVLSLAAGKSTVTDNGDGTKTVAFKKQNGTTTKYTVTFDATNQSRSASSVS